MSGLISRLRSAGTALLGKQERGIPPPGAAVFSSYGVPPRFSPGQSFEAYGDNVWLYSAVNKIAFEIARTPLKLKTTKKNETVFIEKHQALETLHKPQLGKSGKSMLSEMDLEFITAMLDQRIRAGRDPTVLVGVHADADQFTGDNIE